jgi:hypothetical protein
MPLARNLNQKKITPRFKIPKPKKWMIWAALAVAVVVGVFGLINLTKVLSPKANQEEVKIETGDRPLPQVISLWVTADGGLIMRENPDAKSKQIYLIPNSTALSATEVQNDWYKVTYMEKTGWVNKKYVTTTAPAEDPTKNWTSYTNKSFNYSLRFPKDWVVQDYGANPASSSTSYVAFGPQLPATLDPAKLPPVIVRTTTQAVAQLETTYKANQGTVVEPASVSGLSGEKITYNSSSGTQMTAFLVAKGATTFVIEETGGYSDELGRIVASLNLG